jgi:ABC-type lipopolysaccharide export system ATPase subunit
LVYVARGEQAVVTDADEAFGEHVQEQPAQELYGGQRRVLAVARAKADALVIDLQEPRLLMAVRWV